MKSPVKRTSGLLSLVALPGVEGTEIPGRWAICCLQGGTSVVGYTLGLKQKLQSLLCVMGKRPSNEPPKQTMGVKNQRTVSSIGSSVVHDCDESVI